MHSSTATGDVDPRQRSATSQESKKIARLTRCPTQVCFASYAKKEPKTDPLVPRRNDPSDINRPKKSLSWVQLEGFKVGETSGMSKDGHVLSSGGSQKKQRRPQWELQLCSQTLLTESGKWPPTQFSTTRMTTLVTLNTTLHRAKSPPSCHPGDPGFGNG